MGKNNRKAVSALLGTQAFHIRFDNKDVVEDENDVEVEDQSDLFSNDKYPNAKFTEIRLYDWKNQKKGNSSIYDPNQPVVNTINQHQVSNKKKRIRKRKGAKLQTENEDYQNWEGNEHEDFNYGTLQTDHDSYKSKPIPIAAKNFDSFDKLNDKFYKDDVIGFKELELTSECLPMISNWKVFQY